MQLADSQHQAVKGVIHFTTDCWLSPNHRAFVVFCVHFEENGTPVSILLDFVEVPCVGCETTYLRLLLIGLAVAFQVELGRHADGGSTRLRHSRKGSHNATNAS